MSDYIIILENANKALNHRIEKLIEAFNKYAVHQRSCPVT